MKLTAERPGDPVTRLLSARCYRQRAKENRPGKSEWESADFRQSTELLRGLCDEYPAVPDFAYELTEALGDFHVEGLTPDDDQIATTQLQEALVISDKLITAHPQTTAYLASNVHLHNRLAAVEGRRGRPNEEEQVLRKAFELQQRLTAQFPDSSQQAEWEGRIALKFSEAQLRLAHREDAAATLQTAVDHVKKFLAGAAAPPGSTAELARELERRLAELRPAGKTD